MNKFVHRVIHPSERALKRYADNEASSTERSSLADHLAHCSSCRARIQSLRELTASARALPTPQSGSELLERIHQRLARGDVVVLPTDHAQSPRVSLRAIGTVAAAIALTVGVWLLVPSPQLTAGTNVGELVFSPGYPRGGDSVFVEYRPSSELSGEEVLSLRARYRTVLDEGHDLSVKQLVAAKLVRDGDDVFRGVVDLPDSVVYAVFSVEDTAGRRVDSNGRKLWEVLVHNADGRPSFEALTQRARDLNGRDWELALATAERKSALYPDRPAAWASLIFYQDVVRGGAYVDSMRPAHAERLLGFHNRLSAGPKPSLDVIDAMRSYIIGVGLAPLGGRAVWEYWDGLLERDSSAHPLSIERRMSNLNQQALDDSLAAPDALVKYERLWSNHRVQRRLGAQIGRQIAVAARDTAAILRWTDRFMAKSPREATWYYSRLADYPTLHTEALKRLRGLVRLAERPSDSLRPLELTREQFATRRRISARHALVTMGEVLLKRGQVRAAIDTLDLATREGWDLGLFGRGGNARLAAGDTSGAARTFALIAADPGSDLEASDSLRRKLGPSFDDDSWSRLVEHARESMPQRIGERSVYKRTPESIRVTRLDGTPEDLRAVVRGRPAVVVFWSRTCGPAVHALPRIEALKPKLEAYGIPLVLIIPEPPSAEFRRYASEKGITAPTYHDSWSEALRAFNAAGSPLYFVLDSSGAIRFEDTSLERMLAEAVSLLPPRV